MRTGRSIGIAEDFDIRFGIGLQVLDQRADLGLFGGAELRRADPCLLYTSDAADE